MNIKIAVCGIVLLIAAAVWWFAPWSGASRAAPAELVTYICTETKAVIEAPPQPVPAINPQTGRRTLVRAVYATRTKTWVPAPPEQVLQKNQRLYSAQGGPSPLSFAPPDAKPAAN